jgi:release factor glutamine methyltransferase
MVEQQQSPDPHGPNSHEPDSRESNWRESNSHESSWHESNSLSPDSRAAAALTRSAVVTTLQAAGCVFAEDEADLMLAAAATSADLAEMVGRRTRGDPLEYILGWAEFCGLRIAVDPGVFVPRRRTEFLVNEAVSHAPPNAVVVDLCCGSGAIGAALAATLGPIDLYAADIDPGAVRCARRNVGARGRVFEGDLYAPLPDSLLGSIDILVANAPYVPTGEIRMMPPEARDHEARAALDGGSDGLDVQRRVAAGALRWLRPGGRLLVETSERQAPASAAILAGNGLIVRIAHSDEWEATVIIATRPGAEPPDATSGTRLTA